jgi:hypothetical protein
MLLRRLLRLKWLTLLRTLEQLPLGAP